MLSPFEGGNFRVTSIIGTRTHPITGAAQSAHYGLDIVGLSSKNILCVKDGTVVRSRIVTNKSTSTWEWGNYVAVQSTGGLVIYYCHMSRRIAVEGQKVKVGDLLGIEGSTGSSTGSHLHIEMRVNGKQCKLPAVPSDAANVATLLGIPNSAGTYFAPVTSIDYASLVVKKCGFEKQTLDYINRYPYAADLWRKLWEQMK